MAGSDGDEEVFASLADFAPFKQNMANMIAQFQAPLQRSMNDIIEASRCPALEGGAGGASRIRTQTRSSADGYSLLDHFPSTVLLGPPVGQPFGNAVAGVLPPTPSITVERVDGAASARAGLRAPTTNPKQSRPGVDVLPFRRCNSLTGRSAPRGPKRPRLR